MIAIAATSCWGSVSADANRFVEAGIPASDRAWAGFDYARAADIFASGAVELPRMSDDLGRPLVLHMTSLDNLSWQHDASLPLATRMADLQKVFLGANAILKLYIDAESKGEHVNNELVRFMAFQLHAIAANFELLEEFIPTVPSFDSDQARVDGLKKVHAGITTVFLGAEVSLSETNMYSADDLTVLLDAMDATLPTLKKAFSAEFKAEMRVKLRADKTRFDNADDIQHIERMLAELLP